MRYRMMFFKHPFRDMEQVLSTGNLVTGAVGLAIFVIALTIPHVFVVAALGLGGATLGYLLQKAQDTENPYGVVRTSWNVRRSYVLLACLVIGLGMSSFLLGRGVILAQTSPWIALLCKSCAYAIFAFSMCYVCFGFFAISRAKHRLLEASHEQLYKWKAAALKARTRDLMAWYEI